MDSLLINGERQPFPGPQSLLQLLKDCGYDPTSQRFIVAINEILIPQGQWAGTQVSPGDCIDIMGAITGG